MIEICSMEACEDYAAGATTLLRMVGIVKWHILLPLHWRFVQSKNESPLH